MCLCVCVLKGGRVIPLGLCTAVVNEAIAGQSLFSADEANDHFLALNLMTL